MALSGNQVARMSLYGGIGIRAIRVPLLISQILNRSAAFNSGTHQYDLSQYFSGATSYSIAPAVEVGWSFNTGTALLEVDTDDADTFGPYTVTATNAFGNTDSNTFRIYVVTSTAGSRGGICFGYGFGFGRRN